MDNNLFLTTIFLDPNRSNDINNINKNILKSLPKDYLDFLINYGQGAYCNDINIQFPDETIIRETYSEYTNFWQYDLNFSLNDLLNAIQIGVNNNGDIICITLEKKNKVFILQRDDNKVLSYDSFLKTINYLTNDYQDKFYVPSFDSEHLLIDLIRDNKLKDINPIHEAFIKEFKFDFSFDEDFQPEYVIKQFGLRIRFDLIYKNNISIIYQKQFKSEIKYIIDRIIELSE